VVRGPGWDQTETLIMSDPTEAATVVQPPAAGEAETLVDPGTGSSAFPPAVGDARRLVPPPSFERTEIRPGRVYRQPRTQTSPYVQAPHPPPPPSPRVQLRPEVEPRRGGRGMLIAGAILAIVILAAIAATATILVLDSGSVGDSGADATTAQTTAAVVSSGLGCRRRGAGISRGRARALGDAHAPGDAEAPGAPQIDVSSRARRSARTSGSSVAPTDSTSDLSSGLISSAKR